MIKKNIVLVDYIVDKDWDFKKALEDRTGLDWEIISWNNRKVGKGIVNAKRYLNYFRSAFKIFAKRRQYKYICSWQQFYGIALAFYLRLFKANKDNKIIIMTFIYKKKTGVVGTLYHKFVQYAINSQYIEKIVCYSRNEIEYYSSVFTVIKEKFEFCTLGEVDKNMTNTYSIYEEVNDSYILSVGRSNRDYETLITQFKGSDIKLEILCDVMRPTQESNITVRTDVHGDDYINKISKAFCVVICLKDSSISAGQLVLIHSYMLGKPVVISPANALLEYVDEGSTALLVEKSNILCAIDKLKTDKTLYDELSRNGRKKYEQNFSIKHLGDQIGDLILLL